MPISPRSRYQDTPITQVSNSKGAAHATVGMRLIGPADPSTIHFRHTVARPQSLEYLAFKYFGISDFWWRIADVNDRRFPLDYDAGDVVNIPGEEQVGLVIRTRRF